MSEAGDITVEQDVAYTAGERPLLWDIYRSKRLKADAPVALLIHGGGWRYGARGDMRGAALALAERGFVAIAPEYRLLGEVKWPTPLEDVRTAIHAVRARAKALGVNPVHLFLVGYSAGAHLALLAASTSDRAVAADAVAGVGAFFAPTRITPRLAAALGLGADEGDRVSPMTFANTLPPTILFCGDADERAPPEQSVELYQAVRRAGGAADLRLFSHLIHEFVLLPGMMDITIREAAEFFDRTVINKQRFDGALVDLAEFWAKFPMPKAGA